jgi:hypothetical protein
MALWPKTLRRWPAAEKVSVSGEIRQGPKGTMRVPSAPRKSAEKLSDSRVNNPLGVNNLVSFGPREAGSRTPQDLSDTVPNVPRRRPQADDLDLDYLKHLAARLEVSAELDDLISGKLRPKNT